VPDVAKQIDRWGMDEHANSHGGNCGKNALGYVCPRGDEDRVKAEDELRNEQLADAR